MPRFTLTKHADNDFDSEVTVTFQAEVLGLAQEHFEDFLKASGFEIPIEDEIESNDFIAREEDWMWNDAFESKFRMDGPVGAQGADIIKFPISDS